MAVTTTGVSATANPSAVRTGWRRTTVSPTETPRSSAAFWASTIPERSSARPPRTRVGAHTSLSRSMASSITSTSARSGTDNVDPRRSTGSTTPTVSAASMDAISGPLSRTNPSSVADTRSGWSPSSSASLRSMVAVNESSMPSTTTRVAMAAPMPKAVRRVRRGARRTLPSGIRRKALTGQRRWRSSGARPLRAVAWVVVMASTGITRTARHTGQADARSGSTKPSAAACRNIDGLQRGLATPAGGASTGRRDGSPP